MAGDAKEAAKKSSMAAIAAVLLQSEFVRKSEAIRKDSAGRSKWKMMRP
jgi:hypothetical protein